LTYKGNVIIAIFGVIFSMYQEMSKGDIPEIAFAEKEMRKLRAEYKRAARKVKSLGKKFDFLDTIVKPKETEDKKEDIELEWAVLYLFKSIGFNCLKPDSILKIERKILVLNNRSNTNI
jgi:hypothetical protein